MAHIYSVLSSVNGKLNTLFKDFCNEGRASILARTPDFVVIAINRAIDMNPEILIDEKKMVQCNKPIFASTGDDFNPVYLCVVDNIKKPIIDKIPIFVDRKGNQGPGIAIVVGVPKVLFEEETNVTTSSQLLKEIYFGLLNLDPLMQYEATPSIIRLYKSTKIKISSYDLSMVIAAVTCMYINMRNWFFVSDDGGITSPIDPPELLSIFTDKEMPKDVRDKMEKVLNKYGTSISDLNTAIGNGKLLRCFMYGDK